MYQFAIIDAVAAHRVNRRLERIDARPRAEELAQRNGDLGLLGLVEGDVKSVRARAASRSAASTRQLMDTIAPAPPASGN